MSGIVLSSSVRQNLLSLQSTAELLSTTQNRLATGKKVNTALDNPTNFFTAASLDNRASDINNLLDGISNGVQVLQAANTGISSLQKLVDSAKSVANQALQAAVGYSAKSSVTTAAITGATASRSARCRLGLYRRGSPARPSSTMLDTAGAPRSRPSTLLPVSAATSDNLSTNLDRAYLDRQWQDDQVLDRRGRPRPPTAPATSTSMSLRGSTLTIGTLFRRSTPSPALELPPRSRRRRNSP